MKNIFVLSFWIILNSCLFAQSLGEINCEERSGIPLWEKPGSIVVLRMLACGQIIPVLGLDHGYIKTQINENLVGYVEARYVQPPENKFQVDSAAEDLRQKSFGLPQTQDYRIPQQEKQPIITVQPPTLPLPPSGTQNTAKSYKGDQGQPRRHEGGLYFEASHIYYAEPDLMRNKGFMWGLSGDYTYRPGNFMFKVDGRFSTGNVDYWSNGTGTASGLRDYNLETRFTVGYDIKTPSKKAIFTPFIGLGYRYLFDGERGAITTTGHTDYDRKSNYLYSPIGMETTFRLGKGWSLGLTGEYDHFWHGWQYSMDIPIVILGQPMTVTGKNDQVGGMGARGAIRLSKKMGHFTPSFEPFFRYWSIDQSDFTDLMLRIYEPHNTTTEWGLKVGIRF